MRAFPCTCNACLCTTIRPCDMGHLRSMAFKGLALKGSEVPYARKARHQPGSHTAQPFHHRVGPGVCSGTEPS